MNVVISLFRLGVIALLGAILVFYARSKREDKLAREANEAEEAKELEQWWGVVGRHVTENEAEEAALQLRERAP